MQQLVIKDGLVIATHAFGQYLGAKYPGCEIILWDRPLELGEIGTRLRDPRTREEKQNNYADKRRIAYPSIQDQLDMIYWDDVNDTDDWIMAIHRIKTKYPKPVSKRK